MATQQMALLRSLKGACKGRITYVRLATCRAVPGRAEIKIRARIIVSAVPSICVVPRQPWRASCVPAPPCLLWKLPNTCASVLHAMPCHPILSGPGALRMGWLCRQKVSHPFALASARPCPAVPCCAVPAGLGRAMPCRASRAGPKRCARFVRAVPCFHLSRGVPATSCSPSSLFVPCFWHG